MPDPKLIAAFVQHSLNFVKYGGRHGQIEIRVQIDVDLHESTIGGRKVLISHAPRGDHRGRGDNRNQDRQRHHPPREGEAQRSRVGVEQSRIRRAPGPSRLVADAPSSEYHVSKRAVVLAEPAYRERDHGECDHQAGPEADRNGHGKMPRKDCHLAALEIEHRDKHDGGGGGRGDDGERNFGSAASRALFGGVAHRPIPINVFDDDD